MNLIDFFDRSVDMYPNRAALVYEGCEWTYRKLDEIATRAAHGLRALGVERETTCAVLSRNHPTAVAALLGILKAQGTWTPLHTADGDDRILDVVDSFDVEVLFYQQEFARVAQLVRENLPRVREFICIDGEDAHARNFMDWVAEQATDSILLPWEPDAVCMLRGTGGTTGRPKGVMNTNRNFETTIANYRANLRFDAPPVFLAAAPLSHGAGVLSLVTMAFGGTTVIHRKFDVQDVIRAIGLHRVSFLFLPPTALYMLLSQPGVRDHDYSSLRYFLYGAAPAASAKIREAIGVFGPVMTQGYGQTEVPSSVTFLSPADHFHPDGSINEQRLLSCGRPTPFANVVLLDDDGRIVPEGGVGEIVVRGGLVMKGYYKNPEATAESFKCGWHHTGDIAYRDKDGFIYICDRKKDMIITGGFNVYPLEVEQVILSHPAVQDCAVVGVPDDRWGEAIKAVVELKKGETVSEEELLVLCKGRIGGVKTPKSIDFTPSLPRSAVGKVMRNEVRKPFWEGRARMVS